MQQRFPIGWTVEFSINEGKLDEFTALAEHTATNIDQAEPATPFYEWFLDPDSRRCTPHEWY